MNSIQFLYSLTFKILIGVELLAIMIISLIILSYDLHLYLGKFVNGDLLQIGVFSILLLVTSTGLFFLLIRKEIKTNSSQINSSLSALLFCDFKVLGINLIQGFLSGLAKDVNKNKQNTNLPLK